MFRPGGEPRFAGEVARAGPEAHPRAREAEAVPRDGHVAVGVRPIAGTLDDEDAREQALHGFSVALVRDVDALDQGFSWRGPGRRHGPGVQTDGHGFGVR